MDLHVAVVAGPLSTTPRFRNDGHEATLHLVCQRPAHPVRRPAAVDLVNVLVDTTLAGHVADFLVDRAGRITRRGEHSSMFVQTDQLLGRLRGALGSRAG
jgi:hypothetical protein